MREKASAQLPALINAIRPYLPLNPPFFAEDEVTDRDERFIAAELVREKLFRLLGEEVPYRPVLSSINSRPRANCAKFMYRSSSTSPIKKRSLSARVAKNSS